MSTMRPRLRLSVRSSRLPTNCAKPWQDWFRPADQPPKRRAADLYERPRRDDDPIGADQPDGGTPAFSVPVMDWIAVVRTAHQDEADGRAVPSRLQRSWLARVAQRYPQDRLAPSSTSAMVRSRLLRRGLACLNVLLARGFARTAR